MISGVYYQNEMPVGWQVGMPPSATILHEWMHANAVALSALANMEIQSSTRETEFGNDLEKKLNRVEAKLDLALNLLSSLIARKTPKPESYPVTLSAAAIEWVSRDATPTAGNIIVALFIDPRLPQPLMLPAAVRESVTTNSGTRTTADFTHLSEEVEESLERTVFRNHRRHIQSMHEENRQG